MPVENLGPLPTVDVEIFHRVKKGEVIMIHPHGTMNVSMKFQCNSSNNCADISLKKTKCQPHGTGTGDHHYSCKILGILELETLHGN